MNPRSPWFRCLLSVSALLILANSLPAQVTELCLKSFGVPEVSGAVPQAPLLIGVDGAFYGTTLNGGKSGKGTVFRLNTNGSGYIVLHSFDATGADGQNPYAGLIQATDEALYGTTYSGGSNGVGTVFK